MEKLITEVQHIRDVALISLNGNLTSDADEPLFSLVNSIVASGYVKILLDLGKVSYINSAGFGILIAIVDEIKRSDGEVKFAALSPHFKKTAMLIGLHRFAEFYRTVEEAFSSFVQDLPPVF